MPDTRAPQDQLIGAIMAAVNTGADPNFLAALEGGGAPGAFLGLLGSDNPVHRISAGQALALWLRNAGDVVGAHSINRFLACRAINYAEAEPLMVANVLTAVCVEAVDTGNDAMVLGEAPGWSALLRRLGQTQAARQLRLCRIEAALNQGDYQAAHDLLAEDAAEGPPPPALAPIHERLKGKVAQIVLRPDQTAAPLDPSRIMGLTLDWMRAEDPDNPIITRLATTLAKDAAPPISHNAFPPAPLDVQAIIAAAEGLAASRSPLHALNAVHEAIGTVLARATAGPETYAALLPAARHAIAAADGLGLWEQGCDTRWIETILLRRLGRQPEALARLLTLAARIDVCRRGISDPRWRAGIAVYLQHLPWVTAQTAQACGDGAAMLYAMETAKARILGELRPEDASDTPQDPPAFLAAVRAGLAAAGRRTHLLAFLADTTADDVVPGTVGTLALLLTNAGELLVHEIKLSPGQIASALLELQERVLGGTPRFVAPIDPAQPEQRPFDDVIELLSPLIGWLAPLVNTTISRGDTLVVSPDGPLHNVPFAMLLLAGEPLIEHMAVVAVPSAALLAAGTVAARPARALALLAPSPFERARGETYAEEAATLGASIATESFSDADRLAGALAALPRPVLLYIAAHGEASPGRPLQERGIGLSGDGSVWLTAEQTGALDLAGAHVSLRACLVGIATEITSREALGFVWAVLGAGCTTLVSAVWAVNILSARRYFALFHRAWLADGQDRAAAHRTACRALRAEDGPYAHPFHWAPFIFTTATLAGDVT
jgi:hypothetical protein